MMRYRPALHQPWHRAGWHVFLGWLFPLLFLVVVVGLVVWAVMRLTGPGRPASAPATAWTPPPPQRQGDAALEHVRLRYARGEISREEFVRVSSDLGAPATEIPGTGTPPGSAASS